MAIANNSFDRLAAYINAHTKHLCHNILGPGKLLMSQPVGPVLIGTIELRRCHEKGLWAVA